MNAFEDGKQSLHPGFCVGGVTLALTHTRPWNRSWIKIPTFLVRSVHFRARSDFVYLAEASATALRYNNQPGGYLHVDSKLLIEISGLTKKPLIKILNITLNASIMTEINSAEATATAPWWATIGKYLPQTQEDLFPIAPEDDLLVRDATTGEILTMESLTNKLEALDKNDPDKAAQVRALYTLQAKSIKKAAILSVLSSLFPDIDGESGFIGGANLDTISDESLEKLTQAILALKDSDWESEGFLEGVMQIEETLGMTADLSGKQPQPDAEAAQSPESASTPEGSSTENADPVSAASEATPPVDEPTPNAPTLASSKSELVIVDKSPVSAQTAKAVAGVLRNLSVATQAISDAQNNLASILSPEPEEHPA